MFHKSKLRVEKMEIYRTDVKLKYSGKGLKKSECPKRGNVTKLSSKSIKKLAFYAQNTDVKFVSFVTLTYPGVFPGSGVECKAHLNTFMSWLRSRYKGVNYLWFMEFQQRGAPHFHVMTDCDLVNIKSEISERWYRAVGSGDERHLRAGTNTQRIRKEDGCARYVAKYAAKQYQKEVPSKFSDSGRFWGASRDVKPKPISQYTVKGMTGGDMVSFMDEMGWEYAESLTKPLTYLYNAGQLFKNKLD